MAQYPRFLLCTNPLAEPGAEYILHTQLPRFLAKKTSGSDFEVVIEFDNMIDFYHGDATKIAGVMRRLGDWYISIKQ